MGVKVKSVLFGAYTIPSENTNFFEKEKQDNNYKFTDLTNLPEFYIHVDKLLE